MTDLRTQALTKPAPNAPEEVATVENMRINIAAPKSSDALALLCATPATALRTTDVRSNVRSGKAPVAVQTIWGNRVRVTAPTTGMGHVGTLHIAFGADTVPGSWTWSPPT